MFLILAWTCLAHICLTTLSYTGQRYMLLISKTTINNEEMLYSLRLSKTSIMALACGFRVGQRDKFRPLHKQLSREGYIN